MFRNVQGPKTQPLMTLMRAGLNSREAGQPLRNLLWLNGTMRTWQGLIRSINFLEATHYHTYPKVVTGNYERNCPG